LPATAEPTDVNPLDPSRRQLLASGLAASLAASAGCLGFLGDATGQDESDRSLTLQLHREEETLRDRYVEDLSESEPSWSEAAFEATVAGESYTTQYRRPFYSTPDDPRYARRSGTYYRLGSVVVDEVTTTHPVLRLFSADEGGDATPNAVPKEDLPEPDRRAAQIAFVSARARGNEGGVPVGLVQRGGYVYRREEAVDHSRLLGDDRPEYVTVQETPYRVEVSREQFHEPVYRATVQPVADDPEQVEAALRAKFVEARVASEDLSADARDVLDQAETDGCAEAHPYSSGFQAVLRALHEREYLDGNVEKDAMGRDRGPELLLYDGEYYQYQLRLDPPRA
jgi:hypothetical protein